MTEETKREEKQRRRVSEKAGEEKIWKSHLKTGLTAPGRITVVPSLLCPLAS